MYKNFVIPMTLLLFGGVVVSLAARSAPEAANSGVARRANPCAPAGLNPCAPQVRNPCALQARNPCAAGG